MVRCWYLSDSFEKQQEVDLSHVLETADIIYHYVDPHDYRQGVDELRSKYSYKREDSISLYPEHMQDYEEMTKKFRTEHNHPDEEVRFVLEGKGYFDIRNQRDEWIRIEVIPGDFLILGPGIHHRFIFHEESRGIVLLRLFKDDEPYRIFFRNKEQGTLMDSNIATSMTSRSQSAY